MSNNPKLLQSIKHINDLLPLDWKEVIEYIEKESLMPLMSHQMIDSEIAKISFEKQGLKKLLKTLKE